MGKVCDVSLLAWLLDEETKIIVLQGISTSFQQLSLPRQYIPCWNLNMTVEINLLVALIFTVGLLLLASVPRCKSFSPSILTSHHHTYHPVWEENIKK